jgi:bifunctional DNase/RNase
VAAGFTGSETDLSPEAAFAANELHGLIERALATLPPEQQSAVRRHYFEGLTVRETQVLAGAPAGTIKARLHRARLKLRAELAAAWGDEAWPPAQKVKKTMIEVIVHDVVVRTPPAGDVIEAMSGDLPGPGDKEVRRPLPTLVVLKGEPPAAQPAEGADALHFALHRVVVLKEKAGERLLPIWVGPHEGDLIKLLLAGQDAPRPLTYELMKRLLDAAQAVVERVTVNRLHEQVFYAAVTVRAGGRTQDVDGRPSDALALALRAGAPIFVAPDVLDSQGVRPEALYDKLSGEPGQAAVPVAWVSAPVPEFKLPPAKPEK